MRTEERCESGQREGKSEQMEYEEEENDKGWENEDKEERNKILKSDD